MTSIKKLNILFLCTGNACRSQMAEGLCRAHKGSHYHVYSSGITKHGLNPHAVTVMNEIGIDISAHYSKTTDEIKNITFNEVVTVCANADENCPVFQGDTKIRHVGFDDPPKMAVNAKTAEETLAPYRRVRDEIRDFILNGL